MSAKQTGNNYPKLHNAMWPGLVGKGSPGAEPCIDLDTMLRMTAAAEVNGTRFDGVDLFLFDPHISIDSSDDDLKRLADKVGSYGFVVGSVVAPVWPPTGGGSAMGTPDETAKFVNQVRKACRIASKLRDLGIRPYGVVRIDSACGVGDWAKAPEANQKKIAKTFTQACKVAEEYGERLAAEGEICWGGMHSWRRMLELLEMVNRPQTLGFQADMAHTLLYVMGYNAPEDAILPPEWNWSDPSELNTALRKLTSSLRPWTIDFHVAQNDATVHGSGTHDKTGHHCLPDDPQGKLKVAEHAGFWLRDDKGQLTKAVRHICWDGCMFPNAVMAQPDTWSKILGTMLSVREAHGWSENGGSIASEKIEIRSVSKRKNRVKKTRKPAASPVKRGKGLAGGRKAKSGKVVSSKSANKSKSKKARVPHLGRRIVAKARPRRRAAGNRR